MTAGIVDQGVNSGTNFLTVLIPGLIFGPKEAGTLVLALSVGYIALGVQRAMVGDPLLAHASAYDGAERDRMVTDAAAMAALLGLAGAALGLAAWATGSSLTADMVWLAPWLPAVLVQDAGRYAFLCARRPDQALVLDVVWAVVQAAAVVAILLIGSPPHGSFAAAWGLGALGGAVAYIAMSRVVPWRGRPVRWLREVRHLFGWFAVSAVLAQTQYYLILFLVAAVLDQAAAGGLRYMQLLVLQPIQVMLLAVMSLLVPRTARLSAGRHRDELHRSTLSLARLFAVGAVLIMCVIPVRHELVHLIFPRFAGYANVLIPVAISAAVYAVQAPFTAALRGMQRARALFVVQVIFTSVAVPAAFAGALLGGAVGTAWGLVLGAAAQVAAILIGYRRGIDRLGQSRQAAPMPSPGYQ